ncbi:MAG: hypothetical protein AB7F66_07740 [Bacteriovoracia bacterium]
MNFAAAETIYEVNYRIHCGESPREAQALPGFQGTLKFESGGLAREIRFDLFQGKEKTLVSLGDTAAQPEVTLLPHAGTRCRLEKTATTLNQVDLSRADLDANLYLTALRHSPYLVVRRDQVENRGTDLPLELVYSLHENADAGTVTLRYTVFFSDEDSKRSAADVKGQLARYGRSTDIEWAYEVVFSRKDGAVLGRYFQGGFGDKSRTGDLAGDHARVSFQGKYWGGTAHPILYNFAKNNVFADAPKAMAEADRYIAYHPSLTPDARIQTPEAREAFQFSPAGSYMTAVSEIETRLEGKSPGTVSDYLFATVRGTLLPNQTPFNFSNGAFNISVDMKGTRESFGRFGTEQKVDRLGEDMFQQESIAGIRLTGGLLDGLTAAGGLTAEIAFSDARAFGRTEKFEIARLGCFRLRWNPQTQRYETQTLPVLTQKLEGFGSTVRLGRERLLAEDAPSESVK